MINNMLSSSFIVSCELNNNFNINNLKLVFNSFPALRLISYGTSLKYIIKENIDLNNKKKNIINNEIEFHKNQIIYRFFFDYPDKWIYNQNLLKFISILAIVNDYYTIKLNSLYQYITKVLYEFSNNFHKINSYKFLEHYPNQIIEDVNTTNLILSKQLLNLNKLLKKTNENLNSCKLFCNNLIEKVMHENINNKEIIIHSLTEFNINPTLTTKIIDIIKEKNIDE